MLNPIVDKYGMYQMYICMCTFVYWNSYSRCINLKIYYKFTYTVLKMTTVKCWLMSYVWQSLKKNYSIGSFPVVITSSLSTIISGWKLFCTVEPFTWSTKCPHLPYAEDTAWLSLSPLIERAFSVKVVARVTECEGVITLVFDVWNVWVRWIVEGVITDPILIDLFQVDLKETGTNLLILIIAVSGVWYVSCIIYHNNLQLLCLVIIIVM